MFEHPKIRSAGRDARDVYLAAILYSVRVNSDGFVPSEVVKTLDPMLPPRRNRAGIDTLLTQGLLKRDTRGGYLIANFDTYQETKQDVEERRKAWRERQQRRRDKVCETPPVTRDEAVTVTRESRDTDRPTDRSNKKPLGGAPRRDEIWDTLEELFEPVAPGTNAHGKRNKAAGDLRKHGATAGLIRGAHRRWPKVFPNVSPTDMAIATHFPQLTAELHTVAAPCPECEIGGGLHVDGCSHAPSRNGNEAEA
jgi:hypothetical protein